MENKMKKVLLFLICIALLSCATMSGQLTKKYAGQKVYSCHGSPYYKMSAGIKTVDHISYNDKWSSKIYLIEEDGNQVMTEWTTINGDRNISDDLPLYFKRDIFCSKEEYEQMQQKEAKDKADIEDCIQAQEKAFQARKSMGYEDIMIYSDNEFVNIHNKIVQRPQKFPHKVIGFTPKGILISADCSSVRNLNNVLSDMGGFVKMAGMYLESSCSDEATFIYTNYKSYATNGAFDGRGLIYSRSGSYKYKNKAGITTNVPAYQETSHKVSEIEYKTYLNDKSLICK